MRSLIISSVAAVTLLIPCLRAAAAEAVKADDPSLVLDGAGYFREHIEFGLMRLNGERLRRDGEKLFGRGIRRVEAEVRRLLAYRQVDLDKTDWRDSACWLFTSAQVGDDRAALARLPMVRPAADWAQPGFDDSAFDRQRRGLSPWQSLGWIAYQQSTLYRRGCYLRTYFDVPDPAKATDLTVAVAYRGGARVLVNGHEIGRGHLPAGEVTPETFAADYPPEAYTATKDELPDRPGWGEFVGDIRCRYDQAPPWRRGGDFRTTYGNTAVNRQGWDRLRALRDRRLGPLAIPPKRLRKGRNVLAIEIRTSRYDPLIVPVGDELWQAKWGTNLSTNPRWAHAGLVDVELRSASAAIPTCRRRPPGVQAWAADMHTRLYDRDYNPAGWPAGTVRMVGAQNGTFAGIVAVGTDRELTGLTAACSPLVGGKGSTIPAAAATVQYMVGHGLDVLPSLGTGRCVDRRVWHDDSMVLTGLYRWGDRDRGVWPESVTSSRDHFAYVQQLQFFDHIAPEPPKKVPADACQPVWLSVKVPDDAAPGLYKGAVTISAGGVEGLSVPLELEVVGWRLPDPRQLQTFVQSEQSPYGVARAYGIGQAGLAQAAPSNEAAANAEPPAPPALWSDEHFRLIESSFRQLGRLGNDWVFVPVLADSELGNRGDAPVRWIRRKDGSPAFDYSILDRYLALAVKHLGKPRVVCFDVMHGCGTHTVEVPILDESTGKVERMAVGPEAGPGRAVAWRAFATSLCEHMESLGLRDSMFWGHAFDETPDPGLIGILAEVAPEIGWAAGSHGRVPDRTFRACGRAYGVPLVADSARGWKSPFIHLLITRYAGSIICVEGGSTPFTYRLMCDRAIHGGFNGLGRIGADYFGWTWFDGCRANQYNIAGRAILQTLWPGAAGVDSSARNEAMLEGLQEAEARIFLEQAVDRGVLGDERGAEVETILREHFLSTAHICAGAQDVGAMDVTNGWRGRSRRLYAAAAKVAAVVGLDVDRISFGTGAAISLPAMGRTELTLTLRNWTGRPRRWTATADQPWILPAAREGAAIGQQPLRIVLDGASLAGGQDVAGTLTVTDVAGGTAWPVRIAARVTKAMELLVMREVRFVTGGGSGSDAPHEVIVQRAPVFNVPPGQSEAQEYFLANYTARPQDWKIAVSCDWVAVEPAGGTIAHGASVPVRIVARPKPGSAYDNTVVLSLTAAGGKVKEAYPIRVFAMPPYRTPTVPAGPAVWLRDLPADKIVKRHVDYGFVMGDKSADRMQRPWWAGWYSHSRVSRPCGENIRATVFDYKSTPEQEETYPFQIAGKEFTRGLWVVPHHETVYDIAAAGYTAFAAEVGLWEKYGAGRMANLGARVVFEIYVDGVLRANSGVLGVGDKSRLLVVTGLDGARELKLVTRKHDLGNDELCGATWADPRLIRPE
ncbi:MAG TPA: NPCBM/NEW2 domain-containing protein [Phycisphaerae bacterium]|nr:NPCBM/NEW2 domain-containing protein [Phycisphaerae bacterium]